ncbi:MAG: hypothetical protein OXC18_21025 [Desulfurellaceae bacterium]|nr:hypothetical protein [Desulfurellaceae bacterium]
MVIEAGRPSKNLGYWQMMQEMQTQHEEATRALEVQHEALRKLIARTAR